MGFFKKFGQKAASVGRFGLKAAKAVSFGAKKVAHGVSKYGKVAADLSTAGAGIAMALGQPGIAAGLTKFSQRASRASYMGRQVRDQMKVAGDAIKESGLQKSKKNKQESPFESPPPTQAAVKFESDPPPPHHKRKHK